jgi:hypothetical protein
MQVASLKEEVASSIEVLCSPLGLSTFKSNFKCMALLYGERVMRWTFCPDFSGFAATHEFFNANERKSHA